MKFWHYFVLTGGLFLFLIIGLAWVVFPSLTYSKENGFLSPLPREMSLKENDQVKFLSVWLPFLNKESRSDDPGSLAPTSKSVLMYDAKNDEIIFAKNSEERLPMASLTKIMTAIIALENPRRDNKYLVREEDLVGEDSMGLSVGEVLTQEELLYGLMLPSGNDASEVLASNYPGGREEFIKAMNNKAVSLGLNDTSFSNPSGLQGDGRQYTTAEDLVVITKYALDRFPVFEEIVSTFQHEIPSTDTHKYFFLENATNLVSTYPGVRGVKTGFTPEAGMCLVTYLNYEGQQVIGVILNSENRRGEMKELLDYSLTKLGVTPPPFDQE